METVSGDVTAANDNFTHWRLMNLYTYALGTVLYVGSPITTTSPASDIATECPKNLELVSDETSIIYGVCNW